jgi:hypothetical protein
MAVNGPGCHSQNIIWTEDRSINCHLARSAMNYLLYYIQYMQICQMTCFCYCISKTNKRLLGACNRSPGSKLLSITTQLHCGGHLGGRSATAGHNFWKRTIQWLFHQSLVLIELLVPDKMVFMWISHRVLC